MFNVAMNQSLNFQCDCLKRIYVESNWLNLDDTYEPGSTASYSVCTLPGNIVIVPFNSTKKLVIFYDDHEETVDMKNYEQIFNLTPLDETRCAISFNKYSLEFPCQTPQIAILDISKENNITTFPTPYDAQVMVFFKGVILFCVHQKGISRHDINSGIIDQVFKDIYVDVGSHIDAKNDRICYTNPLTENAVLVLNSRFNVLFKCRDHQWIGEPFGITSDDNMNIFVVNLNPRSIVVISSDGKTVDCLKNSIAYQFGDIYYDPLLKQFFVASFEGTIFVYNKAKNF